MVLVQILFNKVPQTVGSFLDLKEAAKHCLVGFLKNPTYFEANSSFSVATFLPIVVMANTSDAFEDFLQIYENSEGELSPARIKELARIFITKSFSNLANEKMVEVWAKALEENLRLSEIKLQFIGNFDEEEINKITSSGDFRFRS